MVMRSSPTRWIVLAGVLAATRLSAPADNPQPQRAEMSFLDNGKIRLGVDLRLGGAITWLSKSGGENVVNNFDYGRQIQMSFYSGPVPFGVGEKQPGPQWRHLGWNPVQTGDDFRNRPRLIEHRNDGRGIYVKMIPLQWPLDRVESECTFESWLELDGSAVRMRGRITNARSDKTQHPARPQELPAVYLNAPFHRLVSYTGDHPFTGAGLTDVAVQPKGPGPWTHWDATERWSAWLNGDGWGVGVWHPMTTRVGGGFAGKPGAGGSNDNPTAYLTPQRVEILDANITYDFSCAFVPGTADEIRAFALSQPREKKPPGWNFRADRQGWFHQNAGDTGWPIRGALDVQLDRDDPQLYSPPTFWRAEDAPRLILEAAYDGPAAQAEIFWQEVGGGFSEKRKTGFLLVPDGQFRSYEVDLSSVASYSGGLTQLRFDPIPHGAPGVRIRIRRIALVGP